MNDLDSLEVLNPLIRKRKVLVAGRGDVPNFDIGSKVTFNFKTEIFYCKDLEDVNAVVIDDSKTLKKPMELFIGKKFKLPLWEEWLKHMRIGEISQLSIDWKLCNDIYPLLSKSYRSFCKSPAERDEMKKSHCCGLQGKATTGHKDLDELIERPPEKIRFTLELINVEQLKEVDKEVWLMNEKEMQEIVPKLQLEGNRLVSEKKYVEAIEKYLKALGTLEQLMAKEKPGEFEWDQYDRAKIPLLSNLSQCELHLKQYYPAIRHADEVLMKDPGNIKALYRRAKAHMAVWNFDQARDDFNRLTQLDSSLESIIQQNLIELNREEKEKHQEESRLLKGKLF